MYAKAVVSHRWDSVRVCHRKFPNYLWHRMRYNSWIQSGISYTEMGRSRQKFIDQDQIPKRRRHKKDLDRIHSKILKAKKKLVMFCIYVARALFARFSSRISVGLPFDPRKSTLISLRQFIGFESQGDKTHRYNVVRNVVSGIEVCLCFDSERYSFSLYIRVYVHSCWWS